MAHHSHLAIGQNIVIPDVHIRVGVLIANQFSQKIKFLAFLVPKDSNNQAETIFTQNRSSRCGKIVLLGTENHLAYDIDLRFLSKKYNRLVFAIKNQDDQNLSESKLTITLNIEQVGKVATFSSQITLISNRIARVGEIYAYQGTYKFKAFADYFHCEVFKDQFQLTDSLILKTDQKLNKKVTALPEPSSTNFALNQIFNILNSNLKCSYEYKVAVVGTKKVGKTSLMVAMYDQLTKVYANYQINFQGHNVGLLAEFLKNALNFYFLNNNHQLSYNFDFIFEKKIYNSYRTIFGEESSPFYLNLEFAESSTTSEGSLLSSANFDLIKNSDVIIFPFDTVALIEKNGRWHESINKAREIIDCCKHSFINLTNKKLVLLVPLKCETYFLNFSSNNLLAFVEEHYAGLFNFLNGFEESISFAIAPAQTLGNIFLADYQENRSSPEFIFRPIYPDATYSPRDVDQIWIYILSFVLNRSVKSNKWNMSSETYRAVEDRLNRLRSYRKQGVDGFKIIQGFDFL